MQIHSKKVVGATWCPMQTGPAARWMGGGGWRGKLLLILVKQQPIRRIWKGLWEGGGNHPMLWEAEQSRKDNVPTRKG